jgi:phosphoglycolate phosphatase-like HAD superfamily hydrolase
MSLFLFDIDSTLLKDGGAAGTAFGLAFEHLFGCPPEHTDKYGKTDPVIAQEVAIATIGRQLSTAETTALHTRYLELLPDQMCRTQHFHLFDGAESLCEALFSDPHNLLGIQTGNLEACAWLKLAKANFDRYFKFGGFGSDADDRATIIRTAISRSAGFRTPATDDRTMFVIGDTPFDIIAGNLNNAITIGVATGKNSTGELREAGAAAVVESLRDTNAMLSLIKELQTARMRFPSKGARD